MKNATNSNVQHDRQRREYNFRKRNNLKTKNRDGIW